MVDCFQISLQWVPLIYMKKKNCLNALGISQPGRPPLGDVSKLVRLGSRTLSHHDERRLGEDIKLDHSKIRNRAEPQARSQQKGITMGLHKVVVM